MSASGTSDRRQNRTLRELLDEMIALARDLTNRTSDLSPAELDYAHERMEWLAEEIWDSATRRESSS